MQNALPEKSGGFAIITGLILLKESSQWNVIKLV